MDYGSDLDVVLIYDDEAASPISGLAHSEAYARFAELLVTALSSLTREGFLYRVDLRLRPDGRNGATCSGASGPGCRSPATLPTRCTGTRSRSTAPAARAP